MRIRAISLTLVFALFLLLGGKSSAAPTEIRFAGVLVSGRAVHVILVEPESGRSSGWIQIGEIFKEYTLMRYDAASETLIVSIAKEERSLPLTGGDKITASAPVVKIGSREFQIFSDAVESNGGLKVFRGNVTGICAGAHFSCDELTVDSARGEMVLVGAVKLQQGKALVQAQRLRIDR